MRRASLHSFLLAFAVLAGFGSAIVLAFTSGATAVGGPLASTQEACEVTTSATTLTAPYPLEIGTRRPYEIQTLPQAMPARAGATLSLKAHRRHTLRRFTVPGEESRCLSKTQAIGRSGQQPDHRS